jgi:DNA-binding CsgD family transcriptional regulator
VGRQPECHAAKSDQISECQQRSPVQQERWEPTASAEVQAPMFKAINAYLVSHCELVGERAEGVAFFSAAKNLYRLASINYACVNISVGDRARYFVHCIYSDTRVQEFTSKEPIRFESGHEKEGMPKGSTGFASVESAVTLTRRRGETAFFEIASAADAPQQSTPNDDIWREFRILANYFHGHVLRMHGQDADQELLISARELDCLKWTAVGKTALEASIILGISERTVRFHLNAAREKLDCVTTTQAVAKAIVNNLIEI